MADFKRVDMKKIGIFLGYAPEQPIKNQGIGRLLSFIIKGALNNPEIKIIIAMPAWYKNILIDFLGDQQIDKSRIEFLTTKGIPYSLKIRNFLTLSIKYYKTHFKDNKRRKYPFFDFIKKFILAPFFDFIIYFCSSTSSIIFWTSIILLILVTISLILSTIPLLIIGFLYIGLKPIFKKITPLRKIKEILMLLIFFIKTPLKYFKNNLFAHNTYMKLRTYELAKLIKIINKRTDVKSWFIPSLFWPEVKSIRTKKIIAAPDVVFTEFPILFCEGLEYLAYEKIVETLRVGDHYVCYSEHVKERHLVESLGMPANKISVIHHGIVQLGQFFEDNTHINRHEAAVDIINSYQSKKLIKIPYLKDFNFSQTRFIFYSSQLRPHKNFFQLIKAFEILLRKQFLNIKLILTADLYSLNNSTIYSYIKERYLENDIICLTDVPSNVLAALNHLAICAVNPSLFEGGFPFTFTEAYSVGTPSVMSNIPVTNSIIDDDFLEERMLFDPYNLKDMVNKIKWAIQNRDELFKMQAPLYQKFTQRTWDVVAQEYIALLDKFAA